MINGKAQQVGEQLKTAGRLAVGTWALGGGRDWGSDTPVEQAEATLQAAVAQGVRLFDTAPVYGNGRAEEIVGRSLRAYRHSVKIATKCGIVLREGRPDHDLSPACIYAQCEQSLRRLGTDYIDLYQIHWPDPKIPLAESLGALVRLKEQGKIRAIGVCNMSVAQLQEAVRITQIDCVQGPLSLLDNSGRETADWCAQTHIPFMAYGCLGGGILSGKYTKEPNLRRCDARRYFYKYYVGQSFARAVQVAKRVKQIAQAKKVSAGAVALAWVLAVPGVSACLTGVRSPAQLADNIGALRVVLSAQEQQFLYDISPGN